MATVTEHPSGPPNLCRYCRGLLQARRPSDLVVDRNSWDGVSEFQTYGGSRYWDWERNILSTDSVAATASRGCLLCAQLFETLSSSERQQIELFEASLTARRLRKILYLRTLKVRDGLDGSAALSFSLRSRPARTAPFDTNFEQVPPASSGMEKFHCCLLLNLGTQTEGLRNTAEISQSTASEVTFSLIRKWVDQCVANHPKCRSGLDSAQKYLPTRLVSLTELGTSKLLLVDDSTPVLPYATLSHCWGSELPLRLLNGTISELQVEIPADKLCKTFVEAFEIAQRMGLKYIWIDCLCIIQDSDEDWAAESAVMGDIYSNSWLNIAAAHAPNGSGGCYIDRDPDLVRPLTLSVDWPSTYTFSTVPGWNMTYTTLSKRAWVCQELFLAPRTLHFAADQVYWECLQLCANESFPGGHPHHRGYCRSVNPDHYGDEPSVWCLAAVPELKVFGLWGRIVTCYTRGGLTFETDKLVAISGLAMRLHRYTQCRYLAGLWEKYLPYQLLWQVISRKLSPSREPPRAYDNYIAPSWSWASLNAEVICYWPCSRYRDKHDVAIKLVDAHVRLAHPNTPFGQVADGYIRMECHLISGAGTQFHLSQGVHLFWEEYWCGGIQLDLIEDDNDVEDFSGQSLGPAPESIWLVPILATIEGEGGNVHAPGIEGLAIKAVNEERKEFRRIGVFSTLKESKRPDGSSRALRLEDLVEVTGCGPKQVITLL